MGLSEAELVNDPRQDVGLGVPDGNLGQQRCACSQASTQAGELQARGSALPCHRKSF